ncbi:MAG: nitrophenyl compound nitroreductase subunit ArsF family protein [Bacteroidaceae bacterium]|nr:nitrophenyl compound nitroreductase subunit ArsF family protein [Bacteroidaceae bacterium]
MTKKSYLLVAILSSMLLACSGGNSSATKEKTDASSMCCSSSESSPSVTSTDTAAPKPSDANVSAPVVEVLYFYGKQRCITCRSIEKYSREVVETLFKEQLAAGTIAFRTIDSSKKENQELVNQYEVSFSSLFLTTHIGAKASKINLTKLGFAYAKNDPVIFKKKLQAAIEQELKKAVSR